MKNLPENHFWKQIKNRLANYEEEPVDDWDKIAAVIPSNSNTIVSMNRSADMIILVLLAFLLGFKAAQTQYVKPILASGIKTTKAKDEGLNDLLTIAENKIDGEVGKGKASSETVAAVPFESDAPKKALAARISSENLTTPKITSSYQRRKLDEKRQESGDEQSRRFDNEIRVLKKSTKSEDSENTTEAVNANVKLLSKSKTDQLNHSLSNDAMNLVGQRIVHIPTKQNERVFDSTDYVRHPLMQTDQQDSSAILKSTEVVADDEELKPLAPKIKEKRTGLASKPVQKEEQKRRRRFAPSVFLSATPSLAYQKISPAKEDNINIVRLNSPGVISEERLGVSLEGGVQIRVNSKFEIFASGSYYYQQPSISYTYSSADEMNLSTKDDWSFTLSPTANTKKLSYKMGNIGASVGFLYHIRGVKLMHKVGAGIFYQRGMLTAAEGDTYNNAKSTYMGYQLLYRMEYALNSRTSIFAQPTFSRSINSTEELNEPFTVRPYRAGIGFGIVYHF